MHDSLSHGFAKLPDRRRAERSPAGVGGQRRSFVLRATGTLLLVASLAGCTQGNRPLNAASVPLESRVTNATRAAAHAGLFPSDASVKSNVRSRPTLTPLPPGSPLAAAPADAAADGCFVGLALSGGGSRSANFSAAIMFQLQRLGILQRVDYISSVSGGSLPAAYYCAATGDAWNPGNVQDKLTQSFASDAIAHSLLPWNFLALAFTDVSRTDLIADSFTRNLFRDGLRPQTFADLRPDRPRMLVNATDLQSGRRFIFCNESFDELNSDLSAYPLATAVAASSAVPVATHPVTLRDHSTRFKQYRHLIDGGVTDNLAIESLIETYAAHLANAKARGLPDPYPKGSLMIMVDAHTMFDADLSERGDIGIIESLKAAIGLSSTSLVNRASSATLADLIVRSAPDAADARALRGQVDQLNDKGHVTLKDKTGHDARVLYVALSQVSDLSGLPFESFRESVNNIETYFNISPSQAYNLYRAADLLVRQKFEQTLVELRDELDAGGGDAAKTESRGAPARTRPE